MIACYEKEPGRISPSQQMRIFLTHIHNTKYVCTKPHVSLLPTTKIIGIMAEIVATYVIASLDRHEKSWNTSTDRFLGVWIFRKMAWFAAWYISTKADNVWKFLLMYAWNQKVSGISTIMVYFVKICFKDTVVYIHKWCLLHLWKIH